LSRPATILLAAYTRNCAIAYTSEMRFNRLLFWLFYRFGTPPWEGHPLPERLRELIEGPSALPPGKALDAGCGTGETSIYLAQHG
jgi:methylase of polypeptide subunit release factors